MSTAVEPVVEPVVDVVEPVAEPVTTPVVPAAPVAPETYELTLPENAALDAGSVERTAAFARSRGLSNDAAKAALELANTEVASAKDALLKDYQPGGAVWIKQVEGWKADSMADVSLGATPQERTATIQKGVGVLNRFAESHPEQKASVDAFLNGTGLGNHPAMVKLFAWLGESAAEGSLITSALDGSPTKSDAELFYGK